MRMWLTKPDFLWKPEEEWEKCEVLGVDESDPELKVTIKSNAITKIQEENSLPSRLEERISRWSKMIRVLAVVMKFCRRCRKVEKRQSNFVLSASDVHTAELALIRMVQARDMNKEIVF